MVTYEASPALPVQRALGGTCKGVKLDADQETRRKWLAAAKTNLATGMKLANARDDGKRKFEDMTPDEQEILEQYETGNSTREVEDFLKIAPPEKFRSEAMLQSVPEKESTVGASEHAKKRRRVNTSAASSGSDAPSSRNWQ